MVPGALSTREATTQADSTSFPFEPWPVPAAVPERAEPQQGSEQHNEQHEASPSSSHGGLESTAGQPAVTQNSGSPPGVQRNWTVYMWQNFHSSSRVNRLWLLIYFTALVVQVIATIAVLAVTSGQVRSCDRLLQIFLALYVVRCIVAIPILLYLNLSRPPGQGMSLPGPRWLPGLVLKTKSFFDLWTTIVFIFGNYILFAGKSCSQPSSALFGTTVAWIVLGYFLIIVPVIVCSSVVFCLPCALVALRLMRMNNLGLGATDDDIKEIPIVRYRRRAPTVVVQSADGNAPAGDAEKSDVSDRASSDVDDRRVADVSTTTSLHCTIASSTDQPRASLSILGANRDESRGRSSRIPLSRIGPQRVGSIASRPEVMADSANIESGGSVRQAARRPGLFWWIRGVRFPRIRRSNKLKDASQDLDPAYLEDEDAMCAICLNEYEENERLRMLPCKHHFHVDCADEWLHINRTCPLCKRDVGRSDHNDGDGAIASSDLDV